MVLCEIVAHAICELTLVSCCPLFVLTWMAQPCGISYFSTRCTIILLISSCLFFLYNSTPKILCCDGTGH